MSCPPPALTIKFMKLMMMIIIKPATCTSSSSLFYFKIHHACCYGFCFNFYYHDKTKNKKRSASKYYVHTMLCSDRILFAFNSILLRSCLDGETVRRRECKLLSRYLGDIRYRYIGRDDSLEF